MSYQVNYNSRFFRVHAIITDAYGIDPLKDVVVPKLLKITSYRNHSVTVAERGAPDAISYNEYGTEDYWWHIMAYNGICRYSDIVEGTTVKIPDLGSIITVTNDALSPSSTSATNTVTI